MVRRGAPTGGGTVTAHWRRKFRERYFASPVEDEALRQGKREDQFAFSEVVAGICLGEILIIAIALWLGWLP